MRGRTSRGEWKSQGEEGKGLKLLINSWVVTVPEATVWNKIYSTEEKKLR